MTARTADPLGGRVRAGQSDLRRNNLAVVMETLTQSVEPTTRSQLAEETGLTKATVSALVGDLIDALLVTELAKERDGRLGRPGTPLRVSGRRITAIGAEINLDLVTACLMDLSGEVRATRAVETSATLQPGRVLAQLSRLVSSLCDEARQAGTELAGVGIAAPGLVNQRAGELVSAPGLGWANVAVADRIAGSLPDDISVVVDNDANLGAVAVRWRGEPSKLRNFVYISGSVGVGAGIVIDGEVFHGSHGFGSEFGHTVADVNGSVCICGNRGCLETLVGSATICRSAGIEPDGDWLEVLVRRLEERDERALAAVDAAAHVLAAAIVSLVHVVDPSAVVLGGYFESLAPWIREPIVEALELRLGGAQAPVEVLPSRLGRSAPMVGAAATILTGVIRDPLPWLAAAQ